MGTISINYWQVLMLSQPLFQQPMTYFLSCLVLSCLPVSPAVGHPLGRKSQSPVHCLVGSEQEAAVLLAPAVEFRGLREVGITPQRDLAEHGPLAQFDRLVQVHDHAFATEPVAVAVAHEQQFVGMRQRDQPGMAIEYTVVGEVRSLLAFDQCGGNRADYTEDLVAEETGWMTRPDTQLCLVGGIHQCMDLERFQPPAEVTHRRGIGNAFHDLRVREHFAIARQFDVLQSLAVGEYAGDDEHIVRSIIGQLPFDDVRAVVDCVGRAKFLGQELHRSGSAVRKAMDTITQLEVDTVGNAPAPRC